MHVNTQVDGAAVGGGVGDGGGIGGGGGQDL